MEQFAFRILLTGGVGPLPRWKSGIEQNVGFQVIDKQIRLTTEPLAILLPEVAESGLALALDQRSRLVDKCLDRLVRSPISIPL